MIFAGKNIAPIGFDTAWAQAPLKRIATMCSDFNIRTLVLH